MNPFRFLRTKVQQTRLPRSRFQLLLCGKSHLHKQQFLTFRSPSRLSSNWIRININVRCIVTRKGAINPNANPIRTRIVCRIVFICPAISPFSSAIILHSGGESVVKVWATISPSFTWTHVACCPHRLLLSVSPAGVDLVLANVPQGTKIEMSTRGCLKCCKRSQSRPIGGRKPREKGNTF